MKYRNYIFFFKVNEEYGMFSNWYKSYFDLPIQNSKMTNHRWLCVEQYMMAKKAFIFNDRTSFYKICSEYEPSVIKALGKQVQNYNDDIWSAYREAFVFEACVAKFSQNDECWVKLSLTNDDIICEASPYDKIWGIGMDEIEATKPHYGFNWPGMNLLGKCLMNVRKII